MALALFRIGIYALLAVLALWVLRDNVLASFSGLLSDRVLNLLGFGGIVSLAIGFLAMLYEKSSTGRKRTRCKICKKPVIAGEFYCREHLREIVDRARG